MSRDAAGQMTYVVEDAGPPFRRFASRSIAVGDGGAATSATIAATLSATDVTEVSTSAS